MNEKTKHRIRDLQLLLDSSDFEFTDWVYAASDDKLTDKIDQLNREIQLYIKLKKDFREIQQNLNCIHAVFELRQLKLSITDRTEDPDGGGVSLL